MEYIHYTTGAEYKTGIGDYIVSGEGLIELNGIRYLYIIAEAPVGSACVGAGTLRFIHVPGAIVEWKSRKNGSGFSISRVEPVRDDGIMLSLRKLFAISHPSLQVCF